MKAKECCPCRNCSEHCSDYLTLLQQLLEAEALIERLQMELLALQDDTTDAQQSEQ